MGNTGGDLIAWKEVLYREGPHDARDIIHPVSLTSDQAMSSRNLSSVWAEERPMESFGQEQERI